MKFLIIILASLTFSLFTNAQTIIKDIDGNIYNTVRINGVNWSTTNLNTTRFNNGDEIFHATNYTSWENACTNGIPAWRYLNYDEKNEKLHGKEYNREVISILSKNKLKNVLPENTELLDDLDIEFLINQYNKPDKRKELLSQKGWGSETKVMDCENCQKWTVEYRKKVPCHICKDSRKGETVQVDFNGNNKTGWNIFPSFDGYRRFDTYYGNGKVLLISPNDIYSHWWKESESAGYSIRFKEITQAKKKKNEVIESFESYLNNKDFIKADSVLSEIKGKNYLDKDAEADIIILKRENELLKLRVENVKLQNSLKNEVRA